MKSEKAFNNKEHNKLHLNFPNGNWISTIWGFGSYTENYDINSKLAYNLLKDMQTFKDSNDVEIMFECKSEEIEKKIYEKYGDGSFGSVIGHLNIKQWLEILNLLAKDKNE